MQRSDQVSLNAVRVFATVADCTSFKLAAAHLSVTPGAVSRQVLKLEATLGAQLFHRSNNAIHLTESGEAFLRQVRLGLHIIDHAIESVMGDDREVTVQVPTTLAIRWLIPLLNEFKQRWPEISVRIETDDGTSQVRKARADITVAYVAGSQPPNHMRDLAAARGCTPAQIALAWLLSNGDDIIPIPGPKRLRHLEENVAASEISLIPAEISELERQIDTLSVAGERYTREGMKGLTA